VLGEQIDHHVEEEEGSMFPQAKASGIDTLTLGAALLKRKAELLANPGAPPAITKVNDGGGDDPDEHPAYEEASKLKVSSAHPKKPRRAATTKHAAKRASHKAH
jgi:hypothetical protein